jgi:hypothetical protein
MAANIGQVKDRKAVLRDKRAQGIAAMGLVAREGDRFLVTAPALRGRRISFEVWRDESGKVRCNCGEFTEQFTADPGFRCEHILAVKHSLQSGNSESAKESKNNELIGQDKDSENQSTLLNTYTDASEKGGTSSVENPAENVTRFEREVVETELQDEEPVKSQPRANNKDKEHDMKRVENVAFAADEEIQNELSYLDNSEQQARAEFAETLAALKQKIDPSQIRTREGWTDRSGNTHIVEYVEWHTVADILDRIVPSWSHSVRSISQIGDLVAVTASITIDGVTREGIGTGTAESEMGIKKAEHDALKRAAVKFGIARELYQRESEVIERQGSGDPSVPQFPRDPLAKSMADLVTPKQLGMIRALAREAAVDADDECLNVLRCKTEELSKKAASSFIDHLKNSQQNAAGAMRKAS